VRAKLQCGSEIKSTTIAPRLAASSRAPLIQGHPARAIHRELDFCRTSVGHCPPRAVGAFTQHVDPFVAVRFDRRLGCSLVQIILSLRFWIRLGNVR
jgi:hypothetical protein